MELLIAESVVHSITYVSSAKKMLERESLVSLLDGSRVRNLQYGITGMLLYKSGCFIQTIEGPHEPLRRLFHNISNDNTHHQLITLLDEPIEAREFDQWHMGFIDRHEGEIPTLEAYTNFLRDPGLPEHFRGEAKSHAKQLLLNFRDKMQ